MAVESILKRDHILKSLNSLRDAGYKQVVVAGVACGGLALICMTISKKLNLEIWWKNCFKDGRIKLSMNDLLGK